MAATLQSPAVNENGTLDHLRVVDMFVGFFFVFIFLKFFKANICGGFRVDNGVFIQLPLGGNILIIIIYIKLIHLIIIESSSVNLTVRTTV